MLPKPMPLNSGESTGCSLRSSRCRTTRPTWILRSQSKTRLSARLTTKVSKLITENACAMQKNWPCSNVSHQKRESVSASGNTPMLWWLPWWTATTPSSATTTRLPLWKHAPRLSLSRQPPKAKMHTPLNFGISSRQQCRMPKWPLMNARFSNKTSSRKWQKVCLLPPLQLWSLLLKISAKKRLTARPQQRVSNTPTLEIDSYRWWKTANELTRQYRRQVGLSPHLTTIDTSK